LGGSMSPNNPAFQVVVHFASIIGLVMFIGILCLEIKGLWQELKQYLRQGD